ncbi:MAG TPA: hypothetical protein VGS80_20225, partial [Ktedonobacterales bacterium]|nr:hypothetical protein [Ktedonobacterales bacterium]
MQLDTKNEAQEPAQNGHQPQARLTPELAPASAASESGGVAVASQRPVHLPGEMLPMERTVVRGSSLGATYVRARPPVVRQFRPRGQDVVEATELTLMPQSRAGRVGERAKRFL